MEVDVEGGPNATHNRNPIAIQDLSMEFLPSNKDVISYMLFLKQTTNSYHKPVSIFTPDAVKKVREIWQQIPIPSKSYSGVRCKVLDVLKKYQKMVKDTRRALDESFLNRLFNIAACQCLSNVNNSVDDGAMQTLFVECNCSIAAKIPHHLRNFFIDQIKSKTITISSVRQISIDNTNDFDEAETAPAAFEQIELNMNMSVESEGVTDNDPEFNPAEHMSDLSSSDISFQIEPEPIAPRNIIKSVRHLDLREVALESDRRNISNRKAAAILNAGLVAVGLISKTDRRLVVGPHKMRRARIKVRKEVASDIRNNFAAQLLCFSFDGKKDKTLLNSDTGNHTDTIKLENICILRHPEKEFMGIVSIEDSSAHSISQALFDFFKKQDISLENLIGIASDGTNTNTGCHRRIIHFIHVEHRLEKPLHWFTCLLHLLECVLLTYLDGKTSGPSDFFGPIERELGDCHTKPIVEL